MNISRQIVSALPEQTEYLEACYLQIPPPIVPPGQSHLSDPVVNAIYEVLIYRLFDATEIS